MKPLTGFSSMSRTPERSGDTPPGTATLACLDAGPGNSITKH